MKLGFLTNIPVKMGMDNIDKLCSFATANGFACLEVGPTLPIDEDILKKAKDTYNIEVSALSYCRNFLSTDAGEANMHREGLKERIILAGKLGIKTVITSTGIDKSLEEGVYDRADAIRKIPVRSLDMFTELFRPFVSLAKENGVNLAFENCPLMGNIAISPKMWRLVFERFPDNNVGLCYDPSHLVWQFIDPYKPIIEFKDRIFHFHVKDTEINRRLLSDGGFLTDFSWWSYRIPGFGEIDWTKIKKALYDINFDGNVSLEHEDTNFEGSLELVKEGLIKGKDYFLKA